jgi:hypothetical protein
MVHPCSWITQLCLGAKDKSHQNNPEAMDKKAHRLPHYPIENRAQSSCWICKWAWRLQDITSSEIHNEQEHQISTLRTFREEEESLRLKSRNLWLVSGDKNTAFFHKQIRTRLSRNHIAEITSPDGTVLKGTTLIKEAATSHFQQLFKEEGVEDDEEAQTSSSTFQGWLTRRIINTPEAIH